MASTRKTRVKTPTLFGELIRRTRYDWKMTQQEFGQLCGLSGKYISAIEQGRKDPPLRTQLRIERVIKMGKDTALTSDTSENLNDLDVDCTDIVQAIISSKKCVILSELLWLIRLQGTLHSPMTPTLVTELLNNRRASQVLPSAH